MDGEHADVADIFDAAAGDNRQCLCAGEIDGRLDIAPGQHAVAPDIGEQQRRNARILEPPRHIEHRYVGDIGPALGRNKAVARIDTDHNAAGECLCGIADQLRVFQRGRPDNDPRHATLEPALDGGYCADTPADLNMPGERFDNAGHRVTIHGFACKRAVEIDNMEIFSPRLGKQHRLRRGIITINRRAVHIALGKADDLTAFQIDGGEDDQGRHFKNLCSVAMP